MAADTLVNTHITNFEDKLNIYDSTFFKNITRYGGLLDELKTITNTDTNKINLPTESEMAAGSGAAVYSTAQFSNFIRNIINFNIKNFDTLDSVGNKINFVKNTPAANGDAVYAFNPYIKTHIIETLKVINVFVDILEAYKFCIVNTATANIPPSGYKTGMTINSIELVSDTSRFYDSSTMTPSKSDYKNVGYIRNVSKQDDIPQRTVLYLSIESFYTGMSSPNNYDNCFDKTTITTGTMVNEIDNTTKFFPTYSNTDDTRPMTLANTLYARQVYNNRISEDPSRTTDLTLDERNKALVKSLLKTLFNLNADERHISVKALYYYYKFVQLYSTLIINASNVMYANVEVLGTNPKRIETRNMTTKNDTRGVSGIEITNTVPGRDYVPTSPAIEFPLTIATAPSGGTNAVATCTVTTKVITKGTNTVTITERGEGYLTAPSVVATAVDTAAAPSASPPVVAATAVQASFKSTIVPIAIEDITTTQENNLKKTEIVLIQIADTLTYLTTQLTTESTTTDNNTTEIAITPTSNNSTVSPSTDGDKKIVIHITDPTAYTALKLLNNNYDLAKDFVIYDKINKNYYYILKTMDDGSNDFKIKFNAVFEKNDLPIADNVDKSSIGIFLNDDKIPILTKPTTGSPKSLSNANYLVITTKDINAYKSEYIYNRKEVYKLDTDIKFNTTKVEHHKNLYETQYNKNVFLNRQIISYTTIIGAIILMLVAINLFNIEKQLVKTISLASLGAILLLFAIYFISNITYIEAFTMVDGTNKLYNASVDYINAPANAAIKASPSLKKTAKITALKNEIDKQNVKFIGYFEKIIITLPAADSADFYSEIKDVITNDRDNKTYIYQMLEINKVQGTNDMDTLKYEIEQNKLYIIVLLVSSIVFITLYNIYINYISNDKYLSLMLFICAIILIVIVSYYIINSNRRVRTVYKSIYWGPEDSVNF
jgi:hypothetical protein